MRRHLFLLLLAGACSGAGEEAEEPWLPGTGPGNLASPEAALVAAEEAGDWAAAARLLEEIRAGGEPGDLWILRRIQAAEGLGDRGSAARWRQELLLRRPEDLSLRLALARDLGALGRPLEGVLLLEAVAEDPEARILALRGLADLYESAGLPLDAATALERLAGDERVPERGLLLMAASRLRERGGDLDGALRLARQALDLEGVPLDPEERAGLGRLEVLRGLRPPETVEEAREVVLREADPARRRAAFDLLSGASFEGELALFEEICRDPEAEIVVLALRELGLRAAGAEAAALAPRLTPWLHHEDPRVRRECARTLERLGSAQVVPELVAALDPADRSVFRAVRKALHELTGERLSPELDPDAAERERLARAWSVWLAGRP